MKNIYKKMVRLGGIYEDVREKGMSPGEGYVWSCSEDRQGKGKDTIKIQGKEIYRRDNTILLCRIKGEVKVVDAQDYKQEIVQNLMGNRKSIEEQSNEN